jgi:hypothetical protein
LARAPFRAVRSVAVALDLHALPRGPLTDSVSLLTTDPKVPAAAGTRKRKAKWVRGPPDPGVTDTFVDGPRLAACAGAAATATAATATTAAPSAPLTRGARPRIQLDLPISSPPLR